MQPGDADGGIGLVHRAIGLDSQIPFLDALARGEAGRAVISGACVDLVEHDHGAMSRPRHAEPSMAG